MDVIAEKDHSRIRPGGPPDGPPVRPLRIAMCPPEWLLLQRVMNGGPADATYIIQGYITEGLQARGHSLTFLASHHNLAEIACASDLQRPGRAPRTWSASRWFNIASKAA